MVETDGSPKGVSRASDGTGNAVASDGAAGGGGAPATPASGRAEAGKVGGRSGSDADSKGAAGGVMAGGPTGRATAKYVMAGNARYQVLPEHFDEVTGLPITEKGVGIGSGGCNGVTCSDNTFTACSKRANQSCHCPTGVKCRGCCSAEWLSLARAAIWEDDETPEWKCTAHVGVRIPSPQMLAALEEYRKEVEREDVASAVSSPPKSRAALQRAGAAVSSGAGRAGAAVSREAKDAGSDGSVSPTRSVHSPGPEVARLAAGADATADAGSAWVGLSGAATAVAAAGLGRGSLPAAAGASAQAMEGKYSRAESKMSPTTRAAPREEKARVRPATPPRDLALAYPNSADRETQSGRADGGGSGSAAGTTGPPGGAPAVGLGRGSGAAGGAPAGRAEVHDHARASSGAPKPRFTEFDPKVHLHPVPFNRETDWSWGRDTWKETSDYIARAMQEAPRNARIQKLGAKAMRACTEQDAQDLRRYQLAMAASESSESDSESSGKTESDGVSDSGDGHSGKGRKARRRSERRGQRLSAKIRRQLVRRSGLENAADSDVEVTGSSVAAAITHRSGDAVALNRWERARNEDGERGGGIGTAFDRARHWATTAAGAGGWSDAEVRGVSRRLIDMFEYAQSREARTNPARALTLLRRALLREAMAARCWHSNATENEQKARQLILHRGLTWNKDVRKAIEKADLPVRRRRGADEPQSAAQSAAGAAVTTATASAAGKGRGGGGGKASNA